MVNINDGEFNSHEQLNKLQVYSGIRTTESGTSPSVYISEVKLKKEFKKFKDEYIEELFDTEMTTKSGKPNVVQLLTARRKLNEKLETLHPWQLFLAVEILLDKGGYDAAEYVLISKRSDVEPPSQINKMESETASDLHEPNGIDLENESEDENETEF